MNDLEKQVRIARRRLLIQDFLQIAPWCFSAMFVLATAAIIAPKLWPLPVDPAIWPYVWLGGAIVGGFALSIGFAFARRPDSVAAAIEIDHRYGLKERVSSCLMLSEEERESEAGKALVRDAVRRVGQVEVDEQFRVRANGWTAMPACLAVLAFGLTLLSDAQPDPQNQAQAATVNVQKRIQNTSETLKKQIEERRKQAKEKGLEEASDLFKKLEEGVDSLQKKEDVDRQKALVKLNDLARDLQERQKSLLDREDLVKQLNTLKDIKQGPADKMAKAMKQGDFKTAIDQLKELQNKMDKGELSPEQEKQLKEQLAQMKDKLQQMAQAHEQAKQDLEKQIQQKLAEGDREAAGKMQQKLDQMKQQDGQMKKMDQLAQKLAECAECMQSGQMKDAAGQLGEMAASLESMQQELSEMEMLDEALEQLSAAKSSMECENCNGMGCSECQGDGMGMSGMAGMGQGNGMGEGKGRGDRPEEETGTGFYDSQVRAKPGEGKAVVTGIAFGPNKAGEALEEIKSEIESGRRANDDPLTGQRLPKPQRDLTREYFEAFREGE